MTPVSPDKFLSRASLDQVGGEVARPPYLDRVGVDVERPHRDSPGADALPTGIVHFGPGAFHRVHQAWYVDKLLADDPRWGICGVSLRSSEVRDALAPQDGLYTLATLDEHVSFQ